MRESTSWLDAETDFEGIQIGIVFLKDFAGGGLLLLGWQAELVHLRVRLDGDRSVSRSVSKFLQKFKFWLSFLYSLFKLFKPKCNRKKIGSTVLPHFTLPSADRDDLLDLLDLQDHQSLRTDGGNNSRYCSIISPGKAIL